MRLIRVVLLFCAPLYAQETTGNISGTVTDPSGGAVSNAVVTITNVDKNTVLRTLATDANGTYAATTLPIGHYTLSVAAPGFKTSTRTGIDLNVNDRLTIDVTLAVGERTEEVTVEEAPVAVQLQTAEQSNLVTGTQVRELALNTRNYEQLVTLAPGVSSGAAEQVYVGVSNPSGQSNAVSFAINGNRTTQNDWTIDGADNVDRGGNLTLLNYPSVDAIAEFRILRGVYTAEFGRAAGGQINVVTRSGGSAFHGDVYEFVRNNAFAANNWLNNANRVNVDASGKAQTPPLRYNNFGYTIGGPVFIPGIYNTSRNKTFFFWSQEFRRVITSSTPQGTLPTAAELQGNFSTPVCVASSGATCTQTATSITNINPVAAAYIHDIFSQLPVSNSNILFSSFRNVFNARQELIRVDQMFGEKLTVFGRFINDTIPTTEPGGLFTGSGLPGVSGTQTNSPGRGFALHATITLSPTLLNEAGYAYSYGAVISNVTGLLNSTLSPDIHVPLPYPTTLGRVPSVTFPGGSTLSSFGPYRDYNRNHNIFDNLTKVVGKHTLKFGTSINFYEKTENAGRGNEGTFTIAQTPRPAGTGVYQQVWANFLLGNVATFTQASSDITPDIFARQFELYAQDDFRARSNLTINLGVRYANFRQPYDAGNLLTNFDPALYNPANAPQIDRATGLLVPGTGDPLNGVIIAGKNSPYGRKVGNENNRNLGPRVGFSWDPSGQGRTAIRSGYGIYYDVPSFGNYELSIFNNPPYVQSAPIFNTRLENPAAVAATVSLSPPTIRGTPLPFDNPYSQQWSFDVQHQITSTLVADIAYVGTKGTHLLGIVDLNEVPPGLAAASGAVAPGTVVTSATTPPLNALRPYRGYTAINSLETWFNSNYHSLQAFLEKRFSGASLLNLAYTWSKNLTDNRSDNASAPQNTYDRRAEYGLAQFDRRHIFTANYVIEAPWYRKQEGVTGHLLGGWQLSGITQYGSGLPYNVTSSLGTDPAGLGFLGPSAAGPRPDWLCNPNTNAPHTPYQWFNTQCFADVPAGQNRPGNAGRSIIQGPGYGRWDMSAIKNTKLNERVNVQFRAEAFNIFNHPNPLDIGTALGSSTYGRVLSFRDARILQFGLKLYY